MIGTLTWAPAQYLFIYSRLHLLQISPLLSRHIVLALFFEYAICEVPANGLYLASITRPFNESLNKAVKAYVSVAAVAYLLVITTVTSSYTFLAWRESNAYRKYKSLAMF
jgi:hypothetical protein